MEIDFKNRLCSKTDSQKRFSSKVDFENRIEKIIDFGEGLYDFYRIQRIRLNSMFISTFFKNTKIISKNIKKK